MEKFTRRDLLEGGALAAAATLTTGAVNTRGTEEPRNSPEVEKPFPTTGRYEAIVPDTLDLADRARLGIHALIGQIEPKFNYECWWLLYLLPPGVHPHSLQWWDQNPRTLWTLPMFRTMCGSDHGTDLEEKMKASVLSYTTQEGLFLNPPFDTPGASWRSGGAGGRKMWSTEEDFTNPQGIATLLYAMIAYHLRDGDKSMRERGQQLADALSRIAIVKDDYAYYPATSDFGADYTYRKNSRWTDTKEAISDQDDPEGSVTGNIAVIIGALARWHAVTGDKRALATAGRLAKYVMKPQFWTGGLSPWTELGATKEHNAREVQGVHGGVERRPAAFFQAHLAAMTYTFTGLIDYAMNANDAYLKEWVRQGYEYFRNMGLHRIGQWGENCTNNMMAEIAIKLSDAGTGDYWDDVDEYIRNCLVEDQFVDLDLLKEEAKKHNLPTQLSSEYGDFTVDRFLGCLRDEGLIDKHGTLDPTCNVSRDFPRRGLYGSCYMEPFYFVWEAITRFCDGVAQVNLFLNRASPWLDIDSHLPYQGKVVLKNKRCRNIHVRIPKWVDRRAITCRSADTNLAFSWAGNFLILSGLSGDETVTVEFPMVETVETYHLLTREVGPKWWEHKDELPTYIFHMKGSTCIKAEFPNRAKFTSLEPLYPVYQRAHYNANSAPMKTVKRYVHPRTFEW